MNHFIMKQSNYFFLIFQGYITKWACIYYLNKNWSIKRVLYLWWNRGFVLTWKMILSFWMWENWPGPEESTSPSIVQQGLQEGQSLACLAVNFAICLFTRVPVASRVCTATGPINCFPKTPIGNGMQMLWLCHPAHRRVYMHNIQP